MAQLFNLETQQVEDVPDGQVAQAVGSGRYALPKGRVEVRTPDGQRGSVEATEAPEAFRKLGYSYVPAAELEEERLQREYGEATAAATAEGVARGLTLGISDPALVGAGVVTPEALRERSERNPVASGAGELVGSVAPAFLPGGQATPAGAVARISSRAASRLGGTAVSRAAAQNALEGVLYGVGNVVSEMAMEKGPELTGEKVAAEVAMQAFLGGSTGAFLGKLAPRLSGAGDEVAQAAGLASGKVDDVGRASAAAAGAVPPAGGGDDAARAAAGATPPPPSGGAPGPSPRGAGEPPTPPAGGAGGGTPPGGGGSPPGAPPTPPGGGGGGTPPGGDGFDPARAFDEAVGAAGPAAARFRAEAEAGVKKHANTIRGVFEAAGLDFPTPEALVLRGLDVKKAARQRLREKGLDQSAPRALLNDERFREASQSPEAVVQLITTKREEAGQQIGAALKQFDTLAQADELIDVASIAQRVREEIIAPLSRGPRGDKAIARRVEGEVEALLERAKVAEPTPVARPAGVYEVPLSELDDVPVKAWEPGRKRSVEKALDEGKDLGPIRVTQGADGKREIVDGNHRLAVARERGVKNLRVEYVDDGAAALLPDRPRGTNIRPDADAPFESNPTVIATPSLKRLTFAEAEEYKRRLDRYLRWDSNVSGPIQDELRKLRGYLNGAIEQQAEALSKRVGGADGGPFGEWKRSKQLFGQMSELQDIAEKRLIDAKDSNRLFSLSDYLAGLAGFVSGGGPSPAGLAMSAGLAMANKWGRERLPWAMAIALNDLEKNGATKAAARAFRELVRKVDKEAPPEAHPFGPFAEALRRAATRGEAQLWALHSALSADEQYRATVEKAGLSYAPKAEEQGRRRGEALSSVEGASRDFDAKVQKAVDGYLSGSKPAPSTRLANAEALGRAERLAKLSASPEGLMEQLAQGTAALGEHAPAVSAAVMGTHQRAVAFLHQKAPKAPTPALEVPALKRPWKPSDGEVSKFARYIRAVENPASVLEDMASGTVTNEAVEALKAVYPATFEDMREQLLARLAQHGSALDYRQRLGLGLLLQVPADESLQPATLARLQSMHSRGEPERKPRRPGPQGPAVFLTEASESERLQARRSGLS